MAVIKGTKDLKNYQIVSGPSDTRQIRCTSCKNLASQVPDGKGGFIYACACGARFKFAGI